MDKKSKNYIFYIQKYCDDVLTSIKNVDNNYERFKQNKDCVNSVALSILQIGELATTFNKKNSEKALKNELKIFINARNKIAHSYYKVTKKSLWVLATVNVSDLRVTCEKLLSLEHNQEQDEEMEL